MYTIYFVLNLFLFFCISTVNDNVHFTVQCNRPTKEISNAPISPRKDLESKALASHSR